ncbi:MAG TPA: hypothetical protein VFK08_05930 [Rhodanobacteraceae bacterium]|nr:hypothetical protein [Rhodanobacteraceae bacterium]
MNKLILAGAFAVVGTAAFAVPAIAQTAQSATASAQPVATAQPVAAAQPVANARPVAQVRSVPPVDSRYCIRDTGSHIPPAKGKCLPVAGTTYTQQDLQRTGATNIGQALQMLDPAVGVH